MSSPNYVRRSSTSTTDGNGEDDRRRLPGRLRDRSLPKPPARRMPREKKLTSPTTSSGSKDGEGKLTAPPLGRIQMPINNGAAAGVVAAGAATGITLGNAASSPPRAGRLSRRNSHSQMSPVALRPGGEPEEVEQRDVRERSALQAAAAADGAIWVSEVRCLANFFVTC